MVSLIFLVSIAFTSLFTQASAYETMENKNTPVKWQEYRKRTPFPPKKVKPKNWAGLLAYGSSYSPPLPGNHPVVWRISYQFTVAGAAAAFHRFPY